MDVDNLLMQQVIDGDKTAFDTLVKKHRLNAIAFANSFVYDIHLSEDITQECFIKIYINRHSYKQTYTFKTYLFTLVRNKSIDYLRKSKHAQFQDVFIDQKQNSIEELYIEQEQRQLVCDIINSLKQDYKTALYLYAVDNMCYADIAFTMGKTLSQVKILIYRARKKLKNQYERINNDEK